MPRENLKKIYLKETGLKRASDSLTPIQNAKILERCFRITRENNFQSRMFSYVNYQI